MSSINSLDLCQATRIRKHSSERKGQALMNTLSTLRPDMYRKITGTAIDPFYDDSRISAFLDWVDSNGGVRE